jgi:urea transport system substrate-binding protein
MGQQADAMDALHQEAEHLKVLLEKCTELLTLVAGDLASTRDVAALGKEIEIAKELALGLLGKKVEAVAFDSQSNMQLYTQYAQELAVKHQVSAAHAGITSASREVMRPIFRRFGVLYFYNMQYEGGVCDRNTFCTGVTPAQTIEKLVPNVMKLWGKKIYQISADYNYGQITSKWVTKYVRENGGEIVGNDFLPLDVTEFGPTIAKIAASKCDVVWSSLVGGAHMSFYRQWGGAGMLKKIPIASTTFGLGNEHIVLDPSEVNGLRVSYNYFQEIDTPANVAFVKRWHERFGRDYPYISELGMSTYQGIMLWAEAVKAAASTDREKVTKALAACRT